MVKNVRFRYGFNLSWVFYGLNFVINGREKVRYCFILNYILLIFDNKKFLEIKKRGKKFEEGNIVVSVIKMKVLLYRCFYNNNV